MHVRPPSKGCSRRPKAEGAAVHRSGAGRVGHRHHRHLYLLLEADHRDRGDCSRRSHCCALVGAAAVPGRGGQQVWSGNWRARRRWWCRGAVGEAGGEGGVGSTGAEVLHPPLLRTKIGHRLLVGGVGHEGEVGRTVTEVLVEAGGERREEKLVSHLEPDVVELVREGLEPETVGVDGGVVLVTSKKFLLQENNPLKLVVGEEAIDLGPHRVGIIPIAHDGVEDVRRDGEEHRMRVVSMASQLASWLPAKKLERPST